MESQGSIPHSQVPATCPYVEPDGASIYPITHFLKIHLNIIPHLLLGLPSCLFPKGFPTRILYTSCLSPMRATCPTLLNFLDLVTRKILGEQYRFIIIIISSTFSISILFAISYNIIIHPVEMQRNSKVILKVFQYTYCVE